MGRQVEKIKVLIPCIEASKWLLCQGVIIEWKRYDEKDWYHNAGSPDLELRFIKDATLWILQIECKRPGGGHHRDKQKEYRDKYELAHNVAYYLVESKEEMLKIVESHTCFYKEKLNKIDF